jgi:hypothetical protein
MRYLAIFGVLFLITACERISTEHTQALNSDLLAVQAAISSAENEDAQFSGGLIKTLIAARLATLRQTHAMLDQRAKSWTFGIGLRYTVDGKPYRSAPDSKEILEGIEQELIALRTRAAAQQAEAERYSGGLVQALSLAALATTRQTEALLDQKRLALKYELPVYATVGATAIRQANSAGAVTASPATKRDAERLWEIVSIDTRITESNNVWSRFAWKLTLENRADDVQRVNATIEFQDKDGFVVDTDHAYGLVVSGRSRQVFTGNKLITSASVASIERAVAKVHR